MFPISSRPSDVVDSHKSKAPQLYAAAITTYVLAVITVALRFWARRLTKAVIRMDDWTIIVALVCFQDKVQYIDPSPTLTILSVRNYWVLG